jgi:GTPase SAR1 family protein
MKLALAGLDASGKTTLLRLLLTGKVSEHAPTVRMRQDTFQWKKTRMTLVDSTGDSEIGRVWADLACDGYIFIVDGSDRTRLHEVQQELKKLFSKGLPIAVLLNKSDLVTFCPVPELIRLLGLENETLQALPPMQAFECSIGKGLGFHEALDWLASFYSNR